MEHQGGSQRAIQFSAYDQAAAQVYPHGQVGPGAVAYGQVGDVAHLHTVDLSGRFHLQQQIGTALQMGVGFRHKTPYLKGFEALFVHPSANLIAACPPASIPQFGRDPARAVALHMFLKHRPNLSTKRRFCAPQHMALTLNVGLTSTATNPKKPTKPGQGVILMALGQKIVQHPQVERLKMDKAFFKTSRSISNCRTWRRSRSISDVSAAELPGASL